MSWQQYVDSQIIGAGFMYGGIFGHNGAKWASSPGFAIAPQEAQSLAQFLGSSKYKHLKALYEKGLTLCGQKYAVSVVELIDENGWPPVVVASCKDTDKRTQKAVVIWTEKTLIVGIFDHRYSNKRSINSAHVQLGKLADYMISVGY